MIFKIKQKLYWKIITFFKYALAIIAINLKALDAVHSIDFKFIFI